jgi:hypothetical protein
MNRPLFNRVLFFFALLLSTALPALAGHEGGNGGTIIVDGTTYKLSDLEFTADPGQNFALDDDIHGAVQKFADALHALDAYIMPEYGGKDLFFDDVIFGKLVEYRFVGKVPSDCLEVLSYAGAAVGCAQGSLTYIIPKTFSSLSLTEKAELMIEIRLAGDPKISTSDLASWRLALRTLLIKRAGPVGNGVIQLSDPELAALDLFAVQVGLTKRFVQGGGVISFNPIHPLTKLSLNHVVIDAFSKIDLGQYSWPEPTEYSLILDDVQIIHSTLVSSVISIQRSLIIGSKVTSVGPISLSDANIQESSFPSGTTLQVAGFRSLNSVVVGFLKGTFFDFEGATVTTNGVTGNHIRACGIYQVYQEVKGDNLVLGACSAK